MATATNNPFVEPELDPEKKWMKVIMWGVVIVCLCYIAFTISQAIK
jgi:hypothetical protein